MKMYLANWNYDFSIKSVEIVKKTDSSVWILESGRERKHLIETNTSMYCLTYEFAREKTIQEIGIIIDIQKKRLAHYEKSLDDFLAKTSETETNL